MNENLELEAILAPIRSNFHARRRDHIAQCDAISQLLESYTKAVDNAILRELARSHGLASPPIAPDAERLALDLLSKVQNLPELRRFTQNENQRPSSSLVVPNIAPGKREDPKPAPILPQESNVSNATPIALGAGNWPLVRLALAEHPLVIVGGPPHLERLTNLSVNTQQQVEWVDTTRQGTHAIGNLERRIKDKRIAALLILEGLVQHRHSDPLVSTARSAKIPTAYGGKGGRSAIAHALDELERMLQHPR